MKQTAFDIYHPGVPAAYFVGVLVLTMAAMQPVYCVLSLVVALSYSLFLKGWRKTLAAAAWQLPLIVIIAAVNPLFSASGSTEIFRMGLRAIYAESLVYGACMGMMLVAVMVWFSNAACVLTSDKVMALLGNAAPTISLMISFTLRLIPRFVQRGRGIEAVQTACTATCPRTAKERTSSRIRLTSILMSWGMEDSLETSDAMRARGWGAPGRRSTYSRYQLGARDGMALGAIALLAVISGTLIGVALSQFRFYPTVSELVVWWGYVPFVLLLCVPFMLQGEEALRWVR